MTDFRAVTEDFAVSPQITPADVRVAADQGFTLIINNRPDGEAPDQPSGESIRRAAERLGLAYAYVPVTGRPTAEQSAAVREAVEAASGKALAFCRSGTRSITAWALGQRDAGTRGREELISLCRSAGYEIGAAV
jgi:uncharacterized protein (TIGR01244 family)